MPLLGGLFHKRNTTTRHLSPNVPPTATESVASSASNRDSTDGDYVLPDKSLPPPPPIYNLPPAASSSKLKLPFRRKAAVPHPDPKDTSHSVVSLNDPPSPPYISSVKSDSGHGLPPPPRKSSIFAVYNESLQSVHSLPNESSSHVHPDTPSRLSSSDVRSETHSHPAAQAHKRSPGLFSWARERTKSKPLHPSSALSSAPSTSPSVDDSASFNLKSFRHVRADSPATSPEKSPQSLSNSLLAPPPPRPRPRGDSVASDSSQRISVAAFREAQARSRANSPVPSFRPPSTADTLRVDGNGRKRASTVSVVSGTDRPQPNKDAAAAPMPSLRPDSSALDTSSDDSESEDDDEEVDSDGEPVPKPARKRTITRRVDGSRARSDAGHSPVQVSHTRQDPPKLSRPAPPLTNQSGQAPFTRSRASVSTSALTPSGAARRASTLAAANSSSSSNAHAQSKHSSRKQKDDSDESTDSSDTDSEDMPLSDLVAPRRPGSSASNQSNSRPRMPAKPLIDIKSLAGGPPLLTPILRHEDSVKNFNMNRKEQDVEKDQPFSIPAVLALSSSTSPPVSPSASKQNTTPVSKPASTAHHRRSSTDVPADPKPKGPDNDDDLMNAIRLVGALDKELDQPSMALKPSVKPSDRIVPTPIRKREPPTSFTVLSRPAQRQSTAETLAYLSPVSQTQSITAPPALSPQPEIGVRRRAPTISPTAQNDKSETMSVSSAARSSTSRSSSRIPPVPLIHSIPDSPSVKEEYKPGRPRPTSHTSAVNASEGRSQPPPTTLISAMSSSTSSKMSSHGFQPTLMPQRPFASNSSIRGESPAGSSTGDSSSGRAPFTPRDGSDIGVRSKDGASDVGSTLKAQGHAKKQSVTFEDLQPTRGRERAKTDLTGEQKTRERRRSEAKAAIELGKIVNGRGPLVHDDSDEDMGLRGRNPTINVTMENGVHGMIQPGWAAWQQPMATGMNPMVPPQFSNDPGYLAAHQRALLIAKQAYQMAVAQQAMQMAGEEWERGSNVGFGSGGSVYGGGSGGSVYGGGSGGSMYGGGSGGSVYGGMGGGAGMAPMGMMGMPNMGMLMPPNQWARSSVAFPSTTASVYGGISSSQSEFGGAGGWGTRSVYGEAFGPSASRSNYAATGAPNSSASAYGGSSRPRAQTGVAPPSPSSGQSTRTPGKTPVRSRAAPPSSWKSGR